MPRTVIPVQAPSATPAKGLAVTMNNSDPTNGMVVDFDPDLELIVRNTTGGSLNWIMKAHLEGAEVTIYTQSIPPGEVRAFEKFGEYLKEHGASDANKLYLDCSGTAGQLVVGARKKAR
jgi:hypothetical protein